MKQYLISETQRDVLHALALRYAPPLIQNMFAEIKPITRLTDERIAELWDSERESTNSIQPLRFDFARAIERELFGGEQ